MTAPTWLAAHLAAGHITAANAALAPLGIRFEATP